MPVEDKKLSDGLRVRLYDEHGKLKQEYNSFRKPLLQRIIIGLIAIVLIIPLGVYRLLRFIYGKLKDN